MEPCFRILGITRTFLSHTSSRALYTRIQKTYTQSHPHPADRVFPLLCPEEETKWLDHWSYQMIFSESGGAEPHAIFTTPHHGEDDTVWYTVRHYPKERYVEFVRVTPGEMVAHIELRVVGQDDKSSQTLVSYTFTPLTDKGVERLQVEVLPQFEENMVGGEEAINYYLTTGNKLVS
ncbi:MAG TPA: hypothetical protein DCP28_15100 [Cytophagales bacterium]|nr:hypothetical protein [Cytophagales bacterium]